MGKPAKDQNLPKGEYYLTDLVEIAVAQGRSVDSFVVPDPVEGLESMRVWTWQIAKPQCASVSTGTGCLKA